MVLRIQLAKNLQKRKDNSEGISVAQSIENEFVGSWDWVEQVFYIHPCKQEILAFLRSLREKQYDKVFRAGQLRWVLMLSRSLKHGLRSAQHYVAFTFARDGLTMTVVSEGGEKEMVFEKIELNDCIEEQLRKLQLVVID